MTVERMEQQLEKSGSWLLGDYSLADICVIPAMMRLNDIGMQELWADCPNVTQWFALYQDREALQQAFYYGSLLSEQYGTDI